MNRGLKLIAVFLALGLSLQGCATRGAGYIPLVDTHGKSQSVLDNDIHECQQFAKQRADAATGAAAGAIAGALLGALLMPRGYRNEGASKLAVLGGVSGAGQATETQESIIRRCLAGRGYNVLN